ncbi:hypothetical protein Bca52824_027977 [Brassica carinata]|uniref:RING-type domain-containing protein n=1 Tax=Brassica carinata TaxID=52824 RepID=A0A8X8AM18_BRACI|nr:hypothetical protein Bca52824_027977 [Brassica carinata]
MSCLDLSPIILLSNPEDLPQGPLLITVFLRFTKKEYIVMPCNSAPQTTNVEGTCAVCLEDMSDTKEQALCQPPGCAHLFHEDS